VGGQFSKIFGGSGIILDGENRIVMLTAKWAKGNWPNKLACKFVAINQPKNDTLMGRKCSQKWMING